MSIQTMNKRKDWQAGLGIKSHKLFRKRPSCGLSCPSSGHSGTKRRALIARAVFTECPKVGRFLGTPCRSAALLLCIMPHDDFVILRWRFLWYFYDTSCKIFQNVSFFYLIIYQLFISVFSKRMILWHFFHKNFFRMSTCSTVNPKSIWYEIL